MRDLAEVTAHYSHAWHMRFYYQPSKAQMPVPKSLFQTYMHDEVPGPRAMAATQFKDYECLLCDDPFLRQTLHQGAGSFGLA